MRRKLVLITERQFWGWSCSECAWVFKASGTSSGKTLDEIKQNYEHQRDKDFAVHICAEHPRAKKKNAR